MKPIIISLILYTASFAQNSNTFMVFSDLHHFSPSPNFKESLLYEFTIAAIEEEVDFVFITGDLILRDGTEQTNYDSLLVDWHFVLDTLDMHGIKLFACRGNNDVNSSVSWAKLFSGEYTLPNNGPEEEQPYTYSFSYENFLFLSLDQYTEYHKLNQIWIDEQLENNDKPFVFAASHEPAFKVFWTGLSSCPDDRDISWSSLSNNRGKIYFSGHSHFYDHSELIDEDDFHGNNVHQIIVGTGGGGFHSDTTYNGNNGIWEPQRIFHEKSFGYLYVEVTEDDIHTIWKHRTAPFTFEDGGDNYNFILTSIKKDNKLPTEYFLFQNYPNPFNPSTTIKYSLPGGRQGIPNRSNVTLKVFDLLGSKLATLVNKEQPQGNYEFQFDGSDFTSGIYFYRLQVGDFVETRKMILLK